MTTSINSKANSRRPRTTRSSGLCVSGSGCVSDGDGDLAAYLAGDQFMHRVGGSIECVAAVDARRGGAALDVHSESFQIGVVLFGHEHGEPLPHERREGERAELAAHPSQCPAS